MTKRTYLMPIGAKGLHFLFQEIDLLTRKWKSAGRNNAKLVFEEIYINIVTYSQASALSLEMKMSHNILTYVFIDNGIAFNPNNSLDPPIPSKDEVGGFGIYLVKQNTLALSYQRKNNNNVLIAKLREDSYHGKNSETANSRRSKIGAY